MAFNCRLKGNQESKEVIVEYGCLNNKYKKISKKFLLVLVNWKLKLPLVGTAKSYF